MVWFGLMTTVDWLDGEAPGEAKSEEGRGGACGARVSLEKWRTKAVEGGRTEGRNLPAGGCSVCRRLCPLAVLLSCDSRVHRMLGGVVASCVRTRDFIRRCPPRQALAVPCETGLVGWL